MHQFLSILPPHGWLDTCTRGLKGALNGGWGQLPRHKNNSCVKLLNLSKNLQCFHMQCISPSRDLLVKPPQSDCSSKVDKDGIEGDITTNITSGAECRKAGTSRTPLMQESITGGVKGCGALGDGVLDHDRETIT